MHVFYREPGCSNWDFFFVLQLAASLVRLSLI